MNSQPGLTGENFSHKVAAAFDHPLLAKIAAGKVQEALQLAPRQLHVLSPEEASVERALEPESEDVFRTGVRSHAWLGLVGAGIGSLAFAVFLAYGSPMVTSSPGLAAAVLIGFGTGAGMLIGGMLPPRPDEDPYLHRVADTLRDERSVVVVHSKDPKECSAVQRELQRLGALTIRTL